MTNVEQRLLVLTPTGRDSELAVDLLRAHGFEAEACSNYEQLYSDIEAGVGALVVADEALNQGFVQRMISILENQPPWSNIPVIILTRPQHLAAMPSSYQRLYQRINVTVLERPLKTQILTTMVQNVLATRQRQYEIRSLLDALEQKVRERDQFLAMLAHELRNPLSVISNSLELLNNTAEVQKSGPLEMAIRQTGVIARLLDDLLDVSRFANNKFNLNIANIGLSVVIANAVDACRRNLLLKRQHLTTSIAGDVVVSGDPTRLVQLISNLLINASKYTPADGRIDIRSSAEGSMVEISVKDTGIGIQPELLATLFEPFVQADQGLERSQGGLGLGLALARTIAELHGGSIRATSAGIGTGSEFIVRLPIASSATTDPIVKPVSGRAIHNGSLRILLAENDPDAGESLQALLNSCGYEAHLAKDGPAALTVAFALQPQIILLDIGLPGMNGYELAQQLRERMHDPALLLVALSGYGQPEDLRRSREAGINYHLVKPLKFERLQEILNSCDTGTR